MTRFSRLVGALAAVAALHAHAADILGKKPGYLLFGASSVPNEQAITRAVWAPGLSDGYVPQGIALDGDYVLVSTYQSTDTKVNTGPCRVYRFEAATGKDAGYFDLPPDCGHAGGMASLGKGIVVVADTRRLYRIDAAKALASGKADDGLTGWVKLGGDVHASFVAFDGTDLWAGTYSKDAGKSRIHRLRGDIFDRMNGKTVKEDKALEMLPLPVESQGGAFDKSGALWISASNSRFGMLYRLDRATGAVQSQYEMVLGLEDLEFDADGRLWTLSEAGSQRWIKYAKTYPVVFQLDVAKLK